jgi:NAD(P)-dependent dehydrogenase (short-subunit alcohol dehydrogenase family)
MDNLKNRKKRNKPNKTNKTTKRKKISERSKSERSKSERSKSVKSERNKSERSKSERNKTNKQNKMNKTKYTIVITGANRGLGKCTVEKIMEFFSKHSMIQIYLIAACRNVEACEIELKDIPRKEGDMIECMELDLSDKRSIDEFVCELRKKCEVIDILINNAGKYNNERTRVMDDEILKDIMQTNFFGPYYLTKQLFSIYDIIYPRVYQNRKNNKMDSNYRIRSIINLSSSKGALGLVKDRIVKEVIKDEKITPDIVEVVAYDLIERVRNLLIQRKGDVPSIWFVDKDPKYGHYAHSNKFSKIFLNLYSLSLYRLIEKYHSNISVNCVDPGWIATDMGGEGAPRKPEQAVDTVVWLVEQSIMTPHEMPSGKFWRDRDEIDWKTAEVIS